MLGLKFLISYPKRKSRNFLTKENHVTVVKKTSCNPVFVFLTTVIYFTTELESYFHSYVEFFCNKVKKETSFTSVKKIPHSSCGKIFKKNRGLLVK